MAPEMMRRPPAGCADMAELRAAIDALDTDLFTLFAERMSYIHRAAELKRDLGIPAEVPDRVAEVAGNAERRATSHGLDPALYGRIWQSIVDAAIAEEKRRLGE